MKRTLIVIALGLVMAAGFASCTAQHGCKATQGLIGYGK